MFCILNAFFAAKGPGRIFSCIASFVHCIVSGDHSMLQSWKTHCKFKGHSSSIDEYHGTTLSRSKCYLSSGGSRARWKYLSFEDSCFVSVWPSTGCSRSLPFLKLKFLTFFIVKQHRQQIKLWSYWLH